MIIHQIEQTHFSDSEALIIQFILNRGMDRKWVMQAGISLKKHS